MPGKYSLRLSEPSSLTVVTTTSLYKPVSKDALKEHNFLNKAQNKMVNQQDSPNYMYMLGF